MFRKPVLIFGICLVIAVSAAQAVSEQFKPVPGTDKSGSGIKSAVPTPSQDGVVLKYKFNVGEVIRYKMVMDMTMNMKMDMPIGTSSPASMQIPNVNVRMVAILRERANKTLANGDTEITESIESSKLTMPDGTVKSAPAAQMPPITIVIGKNGVVKSMKGMNQMNKVMAGLDKIPGMGDYTHALGLVAAFPSCPVKTGDRWQTNVPLPTFGGNLTITDELLGITNSTAYLKQDLEASVAYRAEMPAMQGKSGATSMSVDTIGTVTGTSNVDFSIDKGRMTGSSSDMTLHANLKYAGSGGASKSGSMVMDMTMLMTMTPLSSGK